MISTALTVRPLSRDPERERRQREEVATISAMLQERVEDLAPILLPEGSRHGHDWRAGRGGKLSIRLTGPNRGVFRDFREAKGTDMLGAIQHLLCGGRFRDALAWSRSYLGLQGEDEGALRLARKRAEERRRQSERQAAEDQDKKARQARAIWHTGVELKGTPAADYLQGARGIDLAALDRMPGAIRFHDKVWCKARKGEYPAMVSGLWRLGVPKMQAVHRTFISKGDHGWQKADVDPVRSILGSWPGALVPVTRGETGKRWTQIEEGEVVALGEGIEEALSIASVKPEWRCAAVGFVGNFAKVVLPVWCHVMLCINNDPEGSPASKAIFGDPDRPDVPGAVAALEKMGHVVRVCRPPEGFKDWNDFLRGIRNEG